MNFSRITLIGFGEVGQIIGDDLGQRGANAVIAWDLKFDDPASGPSQALIGKTVMASANAHEAVDGADLIISAVTAEQTIAAVDSIADQFPTGAIFLDMNSASPSVKSEAALAINNAGGRYVEAAVMSPFPPKRLATPMLIGGPHGPAFIENAAELGFSNLSFFDERYGKAAAAKMCRSVMVKGIEALLTEALLTARSHGVEDNVLDSLGDLFPGPDWRALSCYMISRSLTHGERRAEEMREVARTVHEAGVTPHMSTACAERQSWASQFPKAGAAATLGPMLDAILTAKPTHKGNLPC